MAMKVSCPYKCHEGTRGDQDVQFHPFLTSPPAAGEWVSLLVMLLDIQTQILWNVMLC